MIFVSPESRWVLLDAINGDTLLNLEELMSKYQLTRYTALKIRKELTEAGYIVTRNENQGGGFIVKRTYVTTAGYDYMESEPANRSSNIRRRSIELSHKSIELTSSLVPNTSKNKELLNTHDNVREEKMGYDFFSSLGSEDDPRAEAKKARQELSKEVFVEKHERSQRKKFKHRSAKAQVDWEPIETAAEFAFRSQDLWGFPTWNFAQTRLAYAISDSRKRYNSNGEIEVRMMERFFDGITKDTYSDGDTLWKGFIKQYGDLYRFALTTMVTSDKLDQAEVEAEDSWGDL